MKYLRSSLLLVVMVVAVGCAGNENGFRTVPVARWQAVTPSVRDATDARIEASFAAARADQLACGAALADANRAMTAAPPRPSLEQPTTWLARMSTGERSKTDALAAIDRARRAALEANLGWRQRRVEAATLRLDLVAAEREYQRAAVIDDRAPDDEYSLELVKFRGQLGRAQARWFTADAAVADARGQVAQATAQLAAAKESLAVMVRAETPAPPFQLTKWARASVHRRGFKVIDRSTLKPCRRRTCFRQPVEQTAYLTIAEPRTRRR